MGLLQENEEGYRNANAVHYAKNLKGKLILIHGTGDDNVHPQNTWILADELIYLGIQFDMFLYPNRNHGIYSKNATIHVHTKIVQYILDNL